MSRSRGGVSLPLASRSALLLVILDRNNKEDQQGDALDPRQQEEVVVQRAFIDITWKERTQGHYQKELRGKTAILMKIRGCKAK